MENILKKYHPISLGYNCYIKKYLNKYWKHCETQVFDWLGTSMWAVNKLFENDAVDAFTASQYCNTPITKARSIPTHKEYYIRALHDNPQQMADKYQRRWGRMKGMLSKEDAKVVFIRLEEDPTDRLPHPARQENQEEELYYIGEFVDTIKSKYPSLDFRILFLSHSAPSCDIKHRGHHITVVHLPVDKINWPNCGEAIHSVLRQVRYLP